MKKYFVANSQSGNNLLGMSDPDPITEPENLADLVIRARKGDLLAFEQIVRSEQDSVRAYLAVRMTRSDEAEDLAQETFVLAHRQLDSFDEHRPLKPWLLGIAHNLLRNHLRKFRADPVGGHEELQMAFDTYLSQQVVNAHTPRVFIDLEECIQELDPKAKELIEARYVNGESIKELQERVGKGHSALTMYLYRIREVLAECIQRKGAQSL